MSSCRHVAVSICHNILGWTENDKEGNKGNRTCYLMKVLWKVHHIASLRQLLKRLQQLRAAAGRGRWTSVLWRGGILYTGWGYCSCQDRQLDPRRLWRRGRGIRGGRGGRCGARSGCRHLRSWGCLPCVWWGKMLSRDESLTVCIVCEAQRTRCGSAGGRPRRLFQGDWHWVWGNWPGVRSIIVHLDMTWTEDLLTGGARHFWTDGGQYRRSGLRTGPWAIGIRSLQQTACQAEEAEELRHLKYIHIYIDIYLHPSIHTYV